MNPLSRPRQRALALLATVAALAAGGPSLLHLAGLPPGHFRAAADRHARELGIGPHAVIAHRGASYLAPEETAAAYRLAIELGADYLELDLQRSRDGVLVAFHDDTLGRTSDVATRFAGRQHDTLDHFTLAELKQLDVGSWFNRAHPERARPEYVGAPILTLDELLALTTAAPSQPSLYIETKSPERYPGYERQLIASLARHQRLGRFADGRAQVILQSFDLASLQRLQALAPHLPRVYLIDEAMVEREGFAALLTAAATTVDGIGPVGYVAWPWNVAAAHRAGLIVHPYTVNERWRYFLLSSFGVDGFFTDRCELLRRYYGPRSPPAPQFSEKATSQP